MTLGLKVIRQGQVNYFNFSEIPDLRNAKIDTKINFASLLQVLLWMNTLLKEVWSQISS